jgi:6-phosphogluconolactonase
MTIPFDPAPVTPAAPAIVERSFADGASLAVALARSVGNELRAAIARRGSARLALSGGDTPRRFLAALACEPLDWTRVLVLPVDERWVAPTHARSNERLLRETLLQGEGAGARLL